MNKQYSSFSQTKGLLWNRQFDGILSGKLLPPIGAVIDLTDRCNLGCIWCNSQGFRSQNILKTEHVKKIVNELADWGVKSVCYAGGGEPSLHPDFAEIIEYSAEKGLQVGISTNGTQLTQEQISAIAHYARFCGLSVDAGTPATWIRIKRGSRDLLAQLFANIVELVKESQFTSLDLTYKFMLTPENQAEIVTACALASKMGFDNFFVRPAAYENVPGVDAKIEFNVEDVNRQLERIEDFETSHFHVYSNFKRVNGEFKRVLNFKKCQATPLSAIYCADGFAYLCIDYRERSYGKLCKHLDLRKFWGSPEHLKILADIDLAKCPRCAFGHYNEQIESYQADQMYRWFP
jgi:MoaA/NifB/PqqE/SkfB family radical SAM enzyme